jgi:pimeloyl-ACP methyl ester carboxylesterase
MSRIPVLALPGVLCDERLWRGAADSLADVADFTIVPTTTHDSIADLAEHALAQISAERFALAGFSLGGYVSLEIMRRAPEPVAALALIDTGAVADPPQSSEWRRRAIAYAKHSRVDRDAVYAEFLGRLLHPVHTDDRAAIVKLLRSMADTVGTDAFVRQQTAAMHRPDSRPTLATIACPTLILCGEADQVTPLAWSEEMAAGIAGARLVTIEGAGHMAPLEKPDAFHAALRGWLSGVPA